MNVHGMPDRTGSAELRHVLPVLHPLWGADYSAVSHPVHFSFRVQPAQKSSFSRLGGLGAFGNRDSQAGEGISSDWPGKDYGIRKPHPDEIPLSWAEVIHALNYGDIHRPLQGVCK